MTIKSAVDVNQKFHFVGVAGVGMSAVAQAVLGTGVAVSGSERDTCCAASLNKLQKNGITIFKQDGSGISDALSGIVISTAIEDDNPDLLAARRLEIPILHRSDMLATLLKAKKCLAITGTSGKSTVTGMIGWILSELGADPTVINGAPVINWISNNNIGNVRLGISDLWVIEADESDKSLLRYKPNWGVITNVSPDHFSVEETQALFRKFSRNVSEWVLDESNFEPFEDIDLPIPGEHNLENANMAISAVSKLGYDRKMAIKALKSFRGISRRFEIVGSINGITVIDDYAHNPAKIQASLHTAKQEYGSVVAVWRPHGYGPLVKMMDDMVEMFARNCSSEDRIIVMPVYDAGGTANRSVNADELVKRLTENGIDARYTAATDVPSDVASAPGKAILLMGARDPGLPALAKSILAEISRNQCRS